MREQAQRGNRLSRPRLSGASFSPLLRAATLALVVAGAAGCSPEQAVEPPSEKSATAADNGATTIRGRAPEAINGVRSIVVLDPGSAVQPEVDGLVPEPAFMDQHGLAFWPPVLLVREGQRVEFNNSEDVLHNVKVAEGDTGTLLFNVATPPAFGSYEHTFDHQGVFQVSCGIHSGMAATIVVVSTPFAVVAEDDGSFAFEDVPLGSYQLRVWSSESGLTNGKVVEILDRETELVLDDLE